MKNFDLVTVVWGADYINTFTKAGLPSLLAPGNIPSMVVGDIPIRYRIYTTIKDYYEIKKSSAYKLTCNYVNIEFDTELVDSLLKQKIEKRILFNICYKKSIEEANLTDSAFVQLLPDQLFIDGSLSTVAAIARSGKKLIIGPPGYRTNKELVLPKLLSKYKLNDGSISITTKDLVDLSINCIQDYTQKIFWSNYSRLAFHWGIFWNVKNYAILQRSYCIHPLFIYPKNKNEELIIEDLSFEATGYLDRAFPNPEDVYIIKDTNRYFCIGLENYPAPNDYDATKIRNLNKTIWNFLQVPSIIDTALVGKNYIRSIYARNYLKSKIRYGYGDDNKESQKEWNKIEHKSDNFVDNVFTLIDLFGKYPYIEDLGKKFRDLESRAYSIKFRGVGGIIIRIFPLLEMTIIRAMLIIFRKK